MLPFLYHLSYSLAIIHVVGLRNRHKNIPESAGSIKVAPENTKRGKSSFRIGILAEYTHSSQHHASSCTPGHFLRCVPPKFTH